MSYLKFDKTLMINLEQSLPKEMLRTNKSGAYHNTTIVGCNTRKQHGLLVVPIPEMDDQAHVLLSSLDETVIQHGAPFNLGIHQYGDGVFSPNGHKYIREFNCETVPVVTYRVGGVVMTKEKVFISHQNQILIKYTLLEAHSPTTLQLRPFLAFRNANALCVENEVAKKDIRPVNGGISTCIYDGYPELYMQLDKKNEWISDGHWYKGIEYYKDRDRGLPYKEDLWVPGYFEFSMKPGESVIFSASLSETKPESFSKIYNEEIKTRTSRTSFYNCLKNSAEQFYMKTPEGNYIMAGYPWYTVRARDELIALPGCTLAIGRKENFEAMARTFIEALRNFIETGKNDKIIHELDLPDIPLWTVWTLQQYRAHTDNDRCRRMFGKDVKYLVESIRSGKVRNLKLLDNGLLNSLGVAHPVTWMSASIDGKPVIPRSGLIVEFNALWYNAVCFLASLLGPVKKEKKYVDELNALADKIKTSFTEVFYNNAGYLNDYVNGDYTDPEVRPNMAIAIGLEYTPLERRQCKSVLDYCTRELLTPKGLRSLSPKSFNYHPAYRGNTYERELAVHQGPARPWLFGFYADAYLRLFGFSGVGFIERMLIGYEDEMAQGCIGSLSEMYDANPPYKGRGAVSTAKNVGEILRTIEKVKKITKLMNEE